MNSVDCLEQLSACYFLRNILLHRGYRASLIHRGVSKGRGRQLKGLNWDLKVSRNGSIYWALWFLLHGLQIICVNRPTAEWTQLRSQGVEKRVHLLCNVVHITWFTNYLCQQADGWRDSTEISRCRETGPFTGQCGSFYMVYKLFVSRNLVNFVNTLKSCVYSTYKLV